MDFGAGLGKEGSSAAATLDFGAGDGEGKDAASSALDFGGSSIGGGDFGLETSKSISASRDDERSRATVGQWGVVDQEGVSSFAANDGIDRDSRSSSKSTLGHTRDEVVRLAADDEIDAQLVISKWQTELRIRARAILKDADAYLEQHKKASALEMEISRIEDLVTDFESRENALWRMVQRLDERRQTMDDGLEAVKQSLLVASKSDHLEDGPVVNFDRKEIFAASGAVVAKLEDAVRELSLMVSKLSGNGTPGDLIQKMTEIMNQHDAKLKYLIYEFSELST